MEIEPIREKWKATMSDRERFGRQMNYHSFDRCFNMEFGFWDENFQLWPFFAEANIKTNEEERPAKVMVNPDQVSLAIGKGGQNARLAAKLTGWKIDIVENKEQEKKEKDADKDLKEKEVKKGKKQEDKSVSVKTAADKEEKKQEEAKEVEEEKKEFKTKEKKKSKDKAKKEEKKSKDKEEE